MTTEYTDDEFRARLWSAYVAGDAPWRSNSEYPTNEKRLREDFEEWFAEEYPEHTKNLSVLTPEQLTFIVEESLNPREPNEKLKQAQSQWHAHAFMFRPIKK